MHSLAVLVLLVPPSSLAFGLDLHFCLKVLIVEILLCNSLPLLSAHLGGHRQGSEELRVLCGGGSV